MILSIRCLSLTPLWTGDINRDSAKVHETSFLGSLRWWYREIKRAAGEDVCNPTSDDAKERCPRPNKPVCPVCQLFGCTGQARRFRLEVSGLKPQPLFFITHQDVYESNGFWLTTLWGGERSGRRQEARYTLNRQTLFVNHLEETPGYFEVKITPTQPGDFQVLQEVQALLAFIARYGALGARTQNGFGQIALVDIPENPLDIWPAATSFFSILFQLKGAEGLGRYRENIRFVGSAPMGFKDPLKAPFIPCAFDLRYKTSTTHPRTGEGRNLGLRPFFKNWKGSRVADALLGKPQGTKWKSRIHVSHLFRLDNQEIFYLKVFGFVPAHLATEISNFPDVREISAKIKEFFMSEDMFPQSVVKWEHPAP